jgi:hypothetical protein
MTNQVWAECGHQRDPYVQSCVRCDVAREVAKEQGLPLAAVLEGIDRALTAIAAAKEARGGAEVAASLAAAQASVERRRDGALPPSVPPLGAAISVPCRWFANRESFAPVTLEFDDRGIWCHDPKSRVRLLHRRWYQIAQITIEDPDDVRDRVAVLRAASFGLVRARRWDAPHHCYVVVRANNHQEFFFEVAEEIGAVRTKLARMTDWFGQHSATLQQL